MLEYDLKYGRMEGIALRNHVNAGQQLPDFILSKPELSLGLDLFFGAFCDLVSEHTMGMCVGAIPRHCIVDYAREYGFSREQKDDLLFYIKKMDAVYLEHVNKSQDIKKNVNTARSRKKA